MCDAEGEPLFSNFAPLRRAKQRLTVSTSRTALARWKNGCSGILDSRLKFYQVFDLLESGLARRVGKDGRDAMRSGVEKGRHENAALSL